MILRRVFAIRMLAALLLTALGLAALGLPAFGLAGAPLAAQSPQSGALAQPRAGMDRVRAELVVERTAAPGETILLAFRMTPQPGWHGYWLNPGDAGQGATFTWALPSGWTAGAPQYPTPSTYLQSGLMNHVYEQEYAILVPLSVPQTARPGSRVTVRVLAEWLACSATLCVPQDALLEATVAVGAAAKSASGAGPADPRFDRWRAALPAPLGSRAQFAVDGGALRIGIPLPASVKLEAPHLFVSEEQVADYAAPQKFARRGDLLIVTLPRARHDPVVPAALSAVLRLNRAGDGVSLVAAPGPVPSGGTPLETGTAPAPPPLPLLLLAALAGGLLLNVMPCVFPILSLKALSLARAGGNEAEARSEGIAYSAGVIAACLALGGLMLGLRAAGQEIGWAFQLQEPLVVAALLLLAATITANLLGLFEFQVPGFVSLGGTPPGQLGAFGTGLLAAFAATPCTGPFMAAAMGAALLLPPAPALLLFTALGLGIALPFLALAWLPGLRRRLPRPGPWMERFRRWMALPMALTALALIWLASRTGGNGFALGAVLVTVIVIAALILLGRRQRRGLAAGALWWTVLAGVLAVAATGLPGMVRSTAAADQPGLLGAQRFSEAALTEARASGKPVFVYMTADWCLSCKVNERVAIEREATRDAFDKAGVIVLRGDWTRRDPAITRFLAQHGAGGVPLYLWYPAGAAAPQQLPQLLTPDSLTALVSQ